MVHDSINPVHGKTQKTLKAITGARFELALEAAAPCFNARLHTSSMPWTHEIGRAHRFIAGLIGAWLILAAWLLVKISSPLAAWNRVTIGIPLIGLAISRRRISDFGAGSDQYVE